MSAREKEKQQQISAVCSSMSVISSILGPVIIHLSLSLSAALRPSSFNVVHVLSVLNTDFFFMCLSVSKRGWKGQKEAESADEKWPIIEIWLILCNQCHIHACTCKTLFEDWCSSFSLTIYVLVLHNKTVTKRIWIIILSVYVLANNLCVCVWHSPDESILEEAGIVGWMGLIDHSKLTSTLPLPSVGSQTHADFSNEMHWLVFPFFFSFLHSSPFLTHFCKSAVQHWTVD